MDGIGTVIAVSLLVVLAWGALLVVIGQADRALLHQERMAETRASVDRARYQPAYPMLHTLTAPYTEVERQRLPGPSAAPPIITEVPPLALPGVTTLGQVLAQGFRPTQDAILLALGPGGQPLTASVGDDLCHIILCGQTGAGKTNTLRLLVVQLLAAGCEVYLLNPKHTSRHWRTGEDWTAIAAATRPGAAITDKAQIGALLRRIHARELPKRQRLFEAGQKPGVPLFLVIDEWPAIVGWDAQVQAAAPKEAREPLLSDIMADLVRMGREYLIEILTASQDVLVDTMGGTSGDRAQFQTRYYGGGDDTSKRVLMTPQPKGGLPEPPGRGVMYLWATSTGRTPQLVRVPLVDNADIDRLLGAPSRPFAPLRAVPRDAVAAGAHEGAGAADETHGEVVDELVVLDSKGRPLPAEFISQVRALFDQDLGPSDITKALSPSGQNGGDLAVKVGLVYQALVKQVRAELARYR